MLEAPPVQGVGQRVHINEQSHTQIHLYSATFIFTLAYVISQRGNNNYFNQTIIIKQNETYFSNECHSHHVCGQNQFGAVILIYCLVLQLLSQKNYQCRRVQYFSTLNSKLIVEAKSDASFMF